VTRKTRLPTVRRAHRVHFPLLLGQALTMMHRTMPVRNRKIEPSDAGGASPIFGAGTCLLL